MNREPAANYRRYLPADYRKREVVVSRSTAGRYDVGSCWDGGSRSSFQLIRNNQCRSVTKDSSSPFNRGLDTHIETLPGDVIVETGVFCGKAATAHITFIDAAPRLEPVEEMLESFK